MKFAPNEFTKYLNEGKTGKLVRLLTEWRSPLTNMHFVYPSQKFVKSNLKTVIEMASGPLKEDFEI